MCHATVTGILSCFAVKDPQDSAGHEFLASSANEVATSGESALTRDSSSNKKELARGKARELARNEALALRENAHDKALAPTGLARDKALARDKVLVTSAPARGPSESDSDDDAVVVGRSVRTRTENQKNETTTQLSTDKSVERSQRTSGASKKDPQRNTKKSHKKKKAAKETAKKKDGDGEKSNAEEGMFAQ